MLSPQQSKIHKKCAREQLYYAGISGYLVQRGIYKQYFTVNKNTTGKKTLLDIIMKWIVSCISLR